MYLFTGGISHWTESKKKKNSSFSAHQFPSSGIISLPPTPFQERAQFTISCPDGLAHGLSEQNIRLHQIVQEHKVGSGAKAVFIIVILIKYSISAT